MCGVTETDCSCTASISSQNSEHCKFEFNQPLPLDRDCEARVDADITGTGTGPTTLESTPSAHATRATRPATYLSTRWGTDGHGSAGLPVMSEYCAESVLLYVFYVCEAASFVSPYTTTVECRVTCTGHL